MKRKKFHQFIRLERGPVNTALIDYLKGDIFQVDNWKVEAFENGRYGEIPGFLSDLKSEGLLLELEDGEWVPDLPLPVEDRVERPLSLEIEDGVDFDLIFKKFRDFKLYSLTYYGKQAPPSLFPGIHWVVREKNPQRCLAISTISGEFEGVDERIRRFNKQYNSCWGRKVAVTADHHVRPCIYSQLTVGKLDKADPDELVEKLKPYWEITKDKVEKCKECEFRYVCFDCREIARRQGNDLYAANPNCGYNPQTGTWSE